METLTVMLHKMGNEALRDLQVKWVKLYGPASPQVKRIQMIVDQRVSHASHKGL